MATKVIKSARAVAIDEMIASLAKAAGKSVSAYKEFLILKAHTATIKGAKLNEVIAKFDVDFPRKSKGAQSKFSDVETIKLATSTGDQAAMMRLLEEYAAHRAKVEENATKAKNARLAKKAGAVNVKVIGSPDAWRDDGETSDYIKAETMANVA
jgi:hypothetical protein